MPAAKVGAFERWLYGNRALTGARWQAPQGHVPGQYVATYRSATTNAELLALLDSDDGKNITYIAVTIRPAHKPTSELSPQDISEVARAIFGNAVAAKINSPSTSDAKDQDTARNKNGWEYFIEKQLNGTMLSGWNRGWTSVNELAALQRSLGVTAIYVTHNEDEAATLATDGWKDRAYGQGGTPEAE